MIRFAEKICRYSDCDYAGIPQPSFNFAKNKTHADGLANECKACAARKAKEKRDEKKKDAEMFEVISHTIKP